MAIIVPMLTILLTIIIVAAAAYFIKFLFTYTEGKDDDATVVKQGEYELLPADYVLLIQMLESDIQRKMSDSARTDSAEWIIELEVLRNKINYAWEKYRERHYGKKTISEYWRSILS